MATIADNLQAVKARIAAAAADARRSAESVTLLAVSKSQPAGAIEQAGAAGQRAFGENYVQEALEKMEAFSKPGIEWHLIGPLQSNKTRVVAERFDWVHTLERDKIARRLSEQRQPATDAGRAPLNVLVQVNVSGESSKSGVTADEVAFLCATVSSLKNLKLRGLMAIPEPGAARARFHEVSVLYEGLKSEFGFDTLSMGMSDDLELAIAEGATLVRVGSAIFGERNVAAASGMRSAA
jgi:pyridoxal phosphate enzyme (YggS family)